MIFARFAREVLVGLALSMIPWSGYTTELSFFPDSLAVVYEQPVFLGVRLDTAEPVTFAQVVIDYDDTKLAFRGADSPLAGFSQWVVTSDIPHSQTTPQTNASVVIQIYGGPDSSLFGEVALLGLVFEWRDRSLCKQSLVGFNARCAATHLINRDGWSTCGDELVRKRATLYSDCEEPLAVHQATWSGVRALYR